MEIRRAFFAGWMGCGALFFVVDGGWRMADAGRRGDGCRFAPGFVGGWPLGCRNSAKTASKILKLASEDAQTVRIFEATQISASQESAPLLQSPVTGSTRLAGVPFHQKKPNQPHPAASSAHPIQLQTHSPSTQASSFPVKTLLKKWITGPSPKAVTSVPIPITPPVR